MKIDYSYKAMEERWETTTPKTPNWQSLGLDDVYSNYYEMQVLVRKLRHKSLLKLGEEKGLPWIQDDYKNGNYFFEVNMSDENFMLNTTTEDFLRIVDEMHEFLKEKVFSGAIDGIDSDSSFITGKGYLYESWKNGQ